MNAHHKKATYRPLPPRIPQHFSSATLQLPLDRSRDARSQSQLWKAVQRVPFGWQMDVVLPEPQTQSSPSLVDHLIQDIERTARHELVRDVNLADLLEPTFLNSFVRKGSLVAISLEAAEGEDVVAIDGRGRLILSVSKSTYELLGLPGRASMHGSFRQRFIIEISLIDPAFRSGKPGFERVKRQLRHWPTQTELFDQLESETPSERGKTFDLVMAFVDDDGQPQPVELGTSQRCTMQAARVVRHQLNGVAIPSADSLPLTSADAAPRQKRQRTSSGALRRAINDDELWWDSFREWRGLAALGVAEAIKWRSQSPPTGEASLEEFGPAMGESEPGNVTCLTINGLLHPETVAKVVKNLVEDLRFRDTPYASIVLRPLPNSPISHTSALNSPIVGTSIRPNGKKRKRGRGRGEEEEANRERVAEVGGWEMVLRPEESGSIAWWLWEGQ